MTAKTEKEGAIGAKKDDWKWVIFSDEAKFEVVNRKNHIYLKRLRSEKFKQRSIKPRFQGGNGSLGMWGCTSHHETGVSQSYQGKIDQFRYQNVFGNCLFPPVDILYGREDA